jgi:hypothetical protein
MNLKDFLKENLPNPFSEQSTLSDLEKKTRLIQENLSFLTIINKTVFLLIISLFLSIFLKISINIFLIILVTEILLAIIACYIKIKNIKSLKKINTQEQNQAVNYRKILITDEYYNLIQSIFGLVATIIGIFLIFFLIYQEILDFLVKFIPEGAIKRADMLKYFLLIFILLKLFQFTTSLIRYKWVNRLKETNDFAELDRDYILINKGLELINFIPFVIIFLSISFLPGMPKVVSLFFIGAVIVAVAGPILEIRRLRKVSFDNKEIDKTVVKNIIGEYQNESIQGYFFGIMKLGFGIFGFGSLGVGKRYYPENTLIVTNFRLIFVQIPISGGNKMVGDRDYVDQNFFFNRGEIKQKGEEILKTNSLPEILKLATNDASFQDIKSVILKKGQIKIEKKNGEKLSYGVMNINDFDLFKETIKSSLKEKVVER